MKDFENIDRVNKDNLNVDIYSDNNDTINIKLIVKNGNIYIESENRKVEVVDENSAVELVNDHYKKIDKSIYQEYEYKLDEIIDKNAKTKYSSIYGIGKSIVSGFRKISNYSILKKILLIGFFASSMFILYSISNMAGTKKVEDTDFITMNKNYLQVEMAKLSVDNYLKYEKLDCIDYILPGNSIVTFKIQFDDFYQTSKLSLNLQGSLTGIHTITKDKLILGRMPENEYEIVVDKMTIDSMLNDSSRIGRHVGIKNESDLLNKEVSVSGMKKFIIVGVVDEKSPSIYAKQDIFVNLLNNKSETEGSGIFYYSDTFIGEKPTEDSEDKVSDYNLYLDDITLTKGRMPDNDYEVIVNKSNEFDMKLNKKIKTKVNGKELTVVGYYESKTKSQKLLVSPNTVKYSIISNLEGITIYPRNEAEVIQKLKYEDNLNVFNRFEKDKENYIEERKEGVTSSLIFAGIILGISLIEIYLMMRSSFLSRIKEIGVYRAIGVKKMDICRMFLGEILAITVCSGMPGIILMTYILKAITKVPYIAKNYVIDGGIIGGAVILVFAFNIIVRFNAII